MSRKIVGPFNRVEGDLEVQLEITDQRVENAWVVSPLYRGFEQILHGKDPYDALIYTPRICGICSVSQSVATARALAHAQGLQMAENGAIATNLILANENIADHLTHFYLFFMPDFARPIYADKSWYSMTESRFKAVTGSASQEVLPARAEFLHLMGLLAGKWPHSLAIQPGGTTRSIAIQEKIRIQSILFNFQRFLEQSLFADKLDNILSIHTSEQLDSWLEQQLILPNPGDFARFLSIAKDLNLSALGQATDRFMSYGAYEKSGNYLFKPGLWEQQLAPIDTATITEDISHSWMDHQTQAVHPYKGVTIPQAEKSDAYTWCKAPRLDGKVVEVGAMARQMVNGQPLIHNLAKQSGGNVRNRVIARLLEIAQVTLAMQEWIEQLEIKAPFCEHAKMPDETQGFGLVEAARGSLGHWIKVKKGRILNYQIVAPTTWNFSPRDAGGERGALEQALLNAPVLPGEKNPIAVQHIVRSFDPCMVCTVH